jgi:phage shock protein E
MPKVISYCPQLHSSSLNINHPKLAVLSSSSTIPTYDIASRDEILQVLSEHPKAIIADLRSLDEILQSGFLHGTGHQWIHIQGGSPTACPLLEIAVHDIFPHLDVPVVVYCASGKRAAVAQSILTQRGYKHVVNAGGYSDLVDLMPMLKSTS